MQRPLSVTRGTNGKPVSSERLVKLFVEAGTLDGSLFTGYPIISTPEGGHAIDAMWIAPTRGIIVFDLVEGTDPGNYGDRQDDSANKLESRLKTYRDLLQRRNLLIPIHTISFAPAVEILPQGTDYIIANENNLLEELFSLSWSESSEQVFNTALSALQNISAIRRGRIKRKVEQQNSRGARLKRLEESIATLDHLQSRAVIETVNGVQRIRGLAGSGKTIVLALKAAYLHAQHPDWRIAVTFNTRSLKGQFRRLITTFSLEQTGEEPDWERLRILNAWGAPGGPQRDGIYYEFCREHGIEYHDFQTARRVFGRGQEFSGVCAQALNSLAEARRIYDAVLVDEAQDFPTAFLRLCYQLLDGNRRLVYAYDELQNLAGESLPAPDELFGAKSDGTPRVQLQSKPEEEAQKDVILRKCYRNSRPVLVTAHALGFGVYRRPPRPGGLALVQMFDHPQLWEDIGYRLKSGRLTAGEPVVLERTIESSPRFLEEHSEVDDLVCFHRFGSDAEQAEWVAAEIERNLSQDELRHDDVIVINPDPLSTRKKVGPIRRRLLELGIQSHLAGVDTDPDVFFQPDSASVTFTGIFRAKGNEAGIIYIINAQDCHSSARNLATIRNRLFTAITRSKAWVRVLGVGDAMSALIREFEELRARDFELQFCYPTAEQRKRLEIVHRDMTQEEARRVKAREQELLKLTEDLRAGSVHPEDIGDELKAELKALLFKGGASDLS